MIKKVKSKGGKPVVFENFRSIREFENTINGREVNDWAFNRGAVRNGSKDDEKGWTGGVTYDEAYKLLNKGWDKPVAKFNKALKKVDEKNIKDRMKVQPFKSVYGSKPIVPNALKGLPKSMMNKKLVAKKSKVINVLYEVSRSASVGSSEIEEFGIDVLKHIYNIERKGWRVRLSMFSSHSQKDTDENGYAWTMLIKDESQPIDVKKLAFPIAHAAMLRLVSFDWFETIPDGQYVDGYGKALYHWPKENRDDFIKAMGLENAYYIYQGCNLDEIFTNVK